MDIRLENITNILADYIAQEVEKGIEKEKIKADILLAIFDCIWKRKEVNNEKNV